MRIIQQIKTQMQWLRRFLCYRMHLRGKKTIQVDRFRPISREPKSEEEELARLSGAAGFWLREEELRALIHWKRTHKCKFRQKDGSQYFGCIGGGYEYRFTPTSLGTIIEVQCACGDSITFYDM